MAQTDEELLAIVRAERLQSIGFEQDDELAAARERSLNYYKGDMSDVPAMPERSKAVSTDIAEAVETILPDLVEIFTGGDDVATFQPVGEEDEEAAQQETDYVNHVVYNENPGFLILYSMFKDALIEKTGVVKFAWEDDEDENKETFEGKSPEEANAIAASAQEQGAEITDVKQAEDGTVSLTLRRVKNKGKVCIDAIAPEDFTVGRDTIRLPLATYCAHRSRPRIQALLEDGYDREKVAALPIYSGTNASGDDTVMLARDTAGEHENATSGNSIGDLRQVEVIEHYVRIDGQIHKLLTGNNEQVLIDHEAVDLIPFAAVTPYLTPHRFYGRSVADVLMEIQRIKTALTRMALDSGYFALNQRMEVAMDKANVFTISDLLRNEPGVPVRSKSGDAIKPISAGALDFDAFGALEYFSTVGEQRTGIVRNAQGLNPDTLHETAKGAMALMTAAQKRVRLIARIFAETGIKDLFLGVHALIRQNATAKAKVRLNNKWVNIDPTTWGERNDMTIEIGLGSGGRDHDLMATTTLLETMQQVVVMQGGVNGPFLMPEGIYKALARQPKALGLKGEFYSDPKTAPPQPPKPDPEAAKAQADAQVKMQAAELDAQANEAQAARKHELDLRSQDINAQIKQRQIDGELNLKERQLVAELDLKERELAAELALKQQQQDADNALAIQQAEHGMAVKGAQAEHAASLAETKVSSDVHTGGEPG